MVINLFWSVLCLTPISIFCYRYMPTNWVLTWSLIAVLASFIPTRLLDRLQVARSTTTYKILGVRFINRFIQDGTIINRLITRKYPQYRPDRQSAAAVEKMIRQTYMFERFHLGMFVFFLLVTGFALSAHLFLWALALTLFNILFNVYPNLLQQYNRIRLRRLRASTD